MHRPGSFVLFERHPAAIDQTPFGIPAYLGRAAVELAPPGPPAPATSILLPDPAPKQAGEWSPAPDILVAGPEPASGLVAPLPGPEPVSRPLLAPLPAPARPVPSPIVLDTISAPTPPLRRDDRHAPGAAVPIIPAPIPAPIPESRSSGAAAPHPDPLAPDHDEPASQPSWSAPAPETLPAEWRHAPANETLEAAPDADLTSLEDEPPVAIVLPTQDEPTLDVGKLPPTSDLLWPGMAPRPQPFIGPLPSTADDDWTMDAEGQEALPGSQARPVWMKRAAIVALVALVVLCTVTLVMRFAVPAVFGSAGSVAAVFNAPMMVIRAAVAGRVTTVAVNAGQIVEPKSPLLTIHTNVAGSADQPVLAGVNGMVRSVETVPGSDLASGAPLVRLQDCDRAFLTVAPDARLVSGQAVMVKLPDLPEAAGTVRASAGIMEPPNALVVTLTPGALSGACPVGAAAAITPVRN